MRLKITFNRTTKQRMLPMDYQYYISAWIYKVLKNADAEYAQFLHSKGYGDSYGKLYKLFCFSRLHFGKPKLWKEKKLFEIPSHEISLQLSFDVPEAASNFIKGLFVQQEFYLGDRFNGLDLSITKIESLPEPDFTETMRYKLQTPWVVSYKPDGEKYAKYLTPEHELFHSLSVKHLIEKFKITRGKELSASQIEFIPDNNYKRSGFLIKSGTNNQTRVIGNLFSFKLINPIEMHKMIWNAGVSEKSSSGFGWVEVDGED